MTLYMQPGPAAANKNYGNEHSLAASGGIAASVDRKDG